MSDNRSAARTLANTLNLTITISDLEVAKVIDDALIRFREEITQLSSFFLQNNYIFLPKFIPEYFVHNIFDSLVQQVDDYKVVEATKTKAKWSISMLDESLQPFEANVGFDAFSALMLHSDIVNFFCDITNSKINSMLTTKRWLNRYCVGDFITPHTDTTGDFQAVFCLAAPSKNHGGEIVIEGAEEIRMEKGDLLLFQASSLSHWTLPLISSPTEKEPERVTGICRYYLKGGKVPNSRVAIYDGEGNLIKYSYNDEQ